MKESKEERIDCIWIWETEGDKEQANRFEERVRQIGIEQGIKIGQEKAIKEEIDFLNEVIGDLTFDFPYEKDSCSCCSKWSSWVNVLVKEYEERLSKLKAQQKGA